MMSLSEFESLQEKTLKEMQDALIDERLIPFIGAGFSKNIAGYPGWNEFREQLSEDIKHDLSALFKNNNLEACEYFIWKKAEILDKKGMLEGSNHFKAGKKQLLEFIEKLEYKFSGDWILQMTPTTRIENMNNILKQIEESKNPDELLQNNKLFIYSELVTPLCGVTYL